ncbi:MAG: hypothetical protein Hals2KO_38050 [Halioglobus sp.]
MRHCAPVVTASQPAVAGAQLRGFTLVEVMVALAIVAITLPALMMTLYQQADDTAYLRDKTQAQLVAADKLTELRLRVAATRELKAEKSSGTARLAERDWRWRMEITQAPGVEKFFRVDIRVGLAEQEETATLYELAAFMSGDLQVDTSRSTTGGDAGRRANQDDLTTGDSTPEPPAERTP